MCFMMIKDPGTTAALRWLAVVFSVSFFMRPFTRFLRMQLPHDGFALRFGAGLFLCFYPAWTISSTGHIEFADPVIFASLAVMACGGFFLNRYVIKKPYVTRDDLAAYLKGFAVFCVIFLAWFWIIGFNPLTDPGTENYMDFGFMQTIYRQKAAIPYDMWFSNSPLNYYYYFGQAISVFMCRLAFTTPEYGYNMMLATFISCVFVMVYELTAGIISALLRDSEKKDLCSRLGGLAGALLAAFGANPHWLLYGVIGGTLQKILGTGGGDSYWYSDGTVYIRTELGDPDNGKNEFPSYSVILGDLHAHVINVIFVLPLLAILFDTCLADDDRKMRPVLWKLVLISMLLGYYKGSNYWDFAIYFVITGGVIVFTDLARHGMHLATLGRIAKKAVVVICVSIISILPFTIHFAKMTAGFAVCDVHSPIHKLLVLWLLPVFFAAWLMAFLFSGKGRDCVDNVCGKGLVALSLCAIGLVLVPELIYVKDIYGEADKRFNTMFKLTYQAYLLFAIISGIVMAVLLYRIFTEKEKNIMVRALAVFTALCVILSCLYTPYSVNRWFGNVTKAEKREGISSLEGLRKDTFYGFEMEAYDVLMQDPKKVINIVEAAGNSYSHESALSVYTGACTPAGWFVHEWMWHQDSAPIKERADRVAYFYQSGDKQYCKDFIRLYNIDYIFVGPAEVIKYPVNWEGFSDLGDACTFTIWQDVALALIKVDMSRCM